MRAKYVSLEAHILFFDPDRPFGETDAGRSIGWRKFDGAHLTAQMLCRFRSPPDLNVEERGSQFQRRLQDRSLQLR